MIEPEMLSEANIPDHRVQGIRGPISLVHLKLDSYNGKKLNKEFFIFGDYHHRKSHCPPQLRKLVTISKFIEKTAVAAKNKSTGSSIVDLFLEYSFPYVSPEDKSENAGNFTIETGNRARINSIQASSYVRYIYNELYSCFQLQKNCKYNNLRGHYVNIRVSTFLHRYNMGNYTVLFDISDAIKNNTVDDLDYNSIIRQMTSSYLWIRDNLDRLYSGLKIRKQLNNIDDRDIAEHISDFFTSSIRTILDRSLYLLDLEFTRVNAGSVWDPVKVKHIILTANTATVLIMDFYTVARMFRSFTNNYNKAFGENFPQINNTSRINNIIYYGGDSHSNNIVRFLTTIPGIQTYENIRSEERGVNYQCLNISRLEQPFFFNDEEIERYLTIREARFTIIRKILRSRGFIEYSAAKKKSLLENLVMSGFDPDDMKFLRKEAK